MSRKILKSLWLVTTHTKQIRKYRFKSFGQSAFEHKFTKDDQLTTVNVFEYFKDKWQIRLQYPQLPTVELFNPADKKQTHFLPMELVTVDEWQRSLKPLTTDQRATVTKKTVVRPGERYSMIRRVVDERHFDQDSYLKDFQMKIQTNEMITVPARILNPPDIIYKSAQNNRETIERVQIGKWALKNHFNTPKEIGKWAVVLVSQREPDKIQNKLADDFARKIPEVRSVFFWFFEKKFDEMFFEGDEKIRSSISFTS